MKNIQKKDALVSFDSIHQYKSFDPAILKGSMVSQDFLDRFVRGPEALFEALEVSQPLTYSALCGCNDLWLLERLRPGMEGSSFTLAVIFEDKFITSQMLNKRLIDRRKKNDGVVLPGVLSSLPRYFHGYYSFFNGFNNPKSKSFSGLVNYDLPGSIESLETIESFCKEYGVSIDAFSKVRHDVTGELIVWIRSVDGLVYLVSNGSEGYSVYEVNYVVSDNYRLLESAAQEIDIYCSDVIKN